MPHPLPGETTSSTRPSASHWDTTSILGPRHVFDPATMKIDFGRVRRILPQKPRCCGACVWPIPTDVKLVPSCVDLWLTSSYSTTSICRGAQHFTGTVSNEATSNFRVFRQWLPAKPRTGKSFWLMSFSPTFRTKCCNLVLFNQVTCFDLHAGYIPLQQFEMLFWASVCYCHSHAVSWNAGFLVKFMRGTVYHFAWLTRDADRQVSLLFVFCNDQGLATLFWKVPLRFSRLGENHPATQGQSCDIHCAGLGKICDVVELRKITNADLAALVPASLVPACQDPFVLAGVPEAPLFGAGACFNNSEPSSITCEASTRVGNPFQRFCFCSAGDQQVPEGFSLAAVSRSISAQLESLFGQFGQEFDDTDTHMSRKKLVNCNHSSSFITKDSPLGWPAGLLTFVQWITTW